MSQKWKYCFYTAFIALVSFHTFLLLLSHAVCTTSTGNDPGFSFFYGKLIYEYQHGNWNGAYATNLAIFSTCANNHAMAMAQFGSLSSVRLPQSSCICNTRFTPPSMEWMMQCVFRVSWKELYKTNAALWLWLLLTGHSKIIRVPFDRMQLWSSRCVVEEPVCVDCRMKLWQVCS